jgi:hypothetical protein
MLGEVLVNKHVTGKTSTRGKYNLKESWRHNLNKEKKERFMTCEKRQGDIWFKRIDSYKIDRIKNWKEIVQQTLILTWNFIQLF